MKKYNFALFLAILAFLALSCDPVIDNPIGTKKLGSLGTDAEHFVFVSIGTSITAGGSDQAIIPQVQTYSSYPYLIAKQIGIPNFVQPNVQEPGIGNRIYLKGISENGFPITEIKLVQGQVTNLNHPTPFNNLGIYAAVANDFIDTSDFQQRTIKYENPFYMVVLRNQELGKSVVDQAIALNPNLITLELGVNDYLWYALYGGTKSTFGMPDNPIPTPTQVYEAIMTAGLTKLTTALPNAKIILFNLPDPIPTPFFNTVPWNALVIDQATADMLNQAYSALGFKFKPGANGFVAESPKSPFGLRQLTQNDYITFLIPQDSLKAGWGSRKPIPNAYVLDSIEVLVVKNTINEYNDVINKLKNMSNNIYIFDINKLFYDIANNGYTVPGASTMNTKFISGMFFSLDGVHPTARGYGALANEVIKFLNKTFGSDIPLVDLQLLSPNIISH